MKHQRTEGASSKVKATRGMDAFVQSDDTSCEHARTLTSDGSTKVLEGSTVQLYVDCELGSCI